MRGQQIGHYLLEEQLGEGAFGVVWRASHHHDARLQVAIKCFRPHLATDPAWRKGLQAEYLALDRLDHAAIVRFRDLVVEDGQIALVMELLEGQVLTAALADGPFTVDRSLRVLERLLAGLAHAHDKGVLHRDIKPANIFLAEAGIKGVLNII